MRLLGGDEKRDLADIVGQDVPINVVQSTSWSEAVAHRFAGMKNGFVYELHVPKGSRALSIMECSAFADEREVLLPDGVTYEIFDVGVSKGGALLSGPG